MTVQNIAAYAILFIMMVIAAFCVIPVFIGGALIYAIAGLGGWALEKTIK